MRFEGIHAAPLALSAPMQPCGFKQMWFRNLPFSIATDSNETSLHIILRCTGNVFHSIRGKLLDILMFRIQHVLLVRIRLPETGFSRRLLSIKYGDKLNTQFERVKRHRELKNQERNRPRNLLDLPLEMRLKIFQCLISGTRKQVVGHQYNGTDSFYTKDTGESWLLWLLHTASSVNFKQHTDIRSRICPTSLDLPATALRTYRRVLQEYHIRSQMLLSERI